MQHDTEVVELLHRYISKRTKRTSRHAAMLDIQSSMRNWDKLLMNRGMMDSTCQCDFIKKPKEPTREDDLLLLDNATKDFLDTNTEADLGEVGSNKLPLQIPNVERSLSTEKSCSYVYKCHLPYTGNHKRRKVTNTVCWHDNALRDQILQFMLDRLLPLINTMDPISIYHHLFRTCARKEYLFKSDPMDANHKFRGHGWHDWALMWLVYKEFV
jgi:hypothetical protein